MDMQIDYKIVKEIGILSRKETRGSIITKELNLISYGDKDPKYDIRNWRDDGDKKTMLKGITLTKEEFETLKTIGMGV